MKKIYALFLFAVLLSCYGLSAQNWSIEPIGEFGVADSQPTEENPNAMKPFPLLGSFRDSGKNNVLAATAENEIEYTPLEGEWVYFSWLTGQEYPTMVSVGTDSERPDYTFIKLDNSYFGTLKIATNNITGDVFNYPDRDEEGNAIYPHLLNEDGTITDMELMTSMFSDGKSPELGSWNSYPLSGQGRLLVRYKQSNGTLYYRYDYLVNIKAKNCKIKAQFARGYYNGEKYMPVKLERGEGVTDVYYIIANDIIDEKRTEADPLWNKEYHYYTVDPKYVREYIDEFKSGERNDAYTVGKVDADAEQFNVPLPTKNGVKEFYIVALSGDEITDMIRDVIEVRLPEEWTDCGEIKLETRNNINGLGTAIILPKHYTLQENADGSLLRIVHPFDTELNPQNNFIYINRSLGIERCYIERSLSPLESCYLIQDVNGFLGWYYYPYMTCDNVSINLIHGIEDSGLLELNESLFADLSNGKGAQISYLQEFDTYLLSKYQEKSYSNHSPAWTIDLYIDNAVISEFYSRGVNLTTGKAVDYIEWTYSYNQNGQLVSADDFTSTIKIEEGKGDIDLNNLLMNKIVIYDPYRIDYRAFDKNGNLIREGSIDTSQHNFRFASAMGRIEYERYFSENNTSFRNADVEILRRDGVSADNTILPEGTIAFTVEDIQETWTYLSRGGEKRILSFNLREGTIYDNLYFEDLGRYDFSGGYQFSAFVILRVEVLENSWKRLENGATVRGTVRYDAFGNNLSDYIMNLQNAYFTLYIPEELCYEYSGVENVAVDETEADVEYFNLQGLRVAAPADGSLVIEKRGNQTRKIIFRN